MNKGEIIIYHSLDNTNFQLEVLLDEDTVWLTQSQMIELFASTKQNISLHINNIFKEGELNRNSAVKYSLTTAKDGKRYKISFYNLDVIISVGYRVKSKRGTQFRIWANQVLKNYLLKGYAVHQRMERIENDIYSLKKKSEEFDLHIKSSLPPHEGIFYDGQIFDALTFAAGVVKSAKKTIILIDNYIDDSVLLLLTKRKKGVSATIYTNTISKQLQHDINVHNTQYDHIDVKTFNRSHDRFLIIDNQEVFHIGASLKDLGKKWFAFSKMNIEIDEMINKLKQ